MDSQVDDVLDEDTIKCLIMTDNHVGFLERDPVRADDSFRAFEEMLQLARKEEVRTHTFAFVHASISKRTVSNGYFSHMPKGGLYLALW